MGFDVHELFRGVCKISINTQLITKIMKNVRSLTEIATVFFL